LPGPGWCTLFVEYDSIETDQFEGFDVWRGGVRSDEVQFLNLGNLSQNAVEQELFESLIDSLVAELGNRETSGLIPDSPPSTVAKIMLAHTGRYALRGLMRGLVHSDHNVRAACAELIGATGIAESVGILREPLIDRSVRVRVKVVEAVARLGGERAVPLLIELLGDDESSVRSAAAIALSRHGGETAIDALLEQINQEQYSGATIRTLGELKAKRAVAALTFLAEGNDVPLQIEVIRALGKIQSPLAAEFLIESLENTNSKVREEAAKALGYDRSEGTVNALREALKDPYLGVRSFAMVSLARQGYVDGVPMAVEFLESRKFKRMGARRHAAETLALLGLEQTRPILEYALSSDPDMWVRVRSAEALGRIGNIESTDGLMKALGDFASHGDFLTGPFWWAKESYPVAEAALEALLEIYPDEEQRFRVVYELARLEKGNWRAKEEASDNLARIGASSVSWLIEAVNKPGVSLAFDVRLVDLLTRIGPASVDPVMRGLAEVPADRAWLLARSLGEIGGSQCMPVLEELKEQSTDQKARYEADRALQILGD
jgi:HEAT repeat protein